METQRKIELQAPDDLAYLVANVRRAAAQRIDEAFPAVEGAQDEDELRSRIEELVEKVSRLFFLLLLLFCLFTLFHGCASRFFMSVDMYLRRCASGSLGVGALHSGLASSTTTATTTVITATTRQCRFGDI